MLSCRGDRARACWPGWSARSIPDPFSRMRRGQPCAALRDPAIGYAEGSRRRLYPSGTSQVTGCVHGQLSRSHPVRRLELPELGVVPVSQCQSDPTSFGSSRYAGAAVGFPRCAGAVRHSRLLVECRQNRLHDRRDAAPVLRSDHCRISPRGVNLPLELLPYTSFVRVIDRALVTCLPFHVAPPTGQAPVRHSPSAGLFPDTSLASLPCR
jgi:hypothetical protein